MDMKGEGRNLQQGGNLKRFLTAIIWIRQMIAVSNGLPAE